MAEKETKVAEQAAEQVTDKKSTVVLNDEPSVQASTTDATEDNKNCTVEGHVCECKPGHCPNKDCKSGHYWTEGTEADEYLYHYDSDDESIKLTDADHRKANPSYKKPETPVIPVPDPDPDPTPDVPVADGCPNDLEEPWAHDKVSDLAEELHLHTGSNYDIVNSWIEDIKNEKDTDAKAKKIEHVAWHIPTGGPSSIKVHHKELIVAELKKL